MKTHIKEGSLHISFKVPSGFKSCKSWGEDFVYKMSASETRGGGHAVRLIGWGTDAEGDDYWILMNSWGEKWGYSYTDPVTNKTWHGLFNLEANRNYVGYSSGFCNPVSNTFEEFLQ